VGDLSVECHQIGSAHRVRIKQAIASFSASLPAVGVLTALLERDVSSRRPVLRNLHAGFSGHALGGKQGRQKP
jgi:hypothetical protein